MDSNQLGDAGVWEVAKWLPKATNLKRLYIGGRYHQPTHTDTGNGNNILSDESATAVIDAAVRHTKIRIYLNRESLEQDVLEKYDQYHSKLDARMTYENDISAMTPVANVPTITLAAISKLKMRGGLKAQEARASLKISRGFNQPARKRSVVGMAGRGILQRLKRKSAEGTDGGGV